MRAWATCGHMESKAGFPYCPRSGGLEVVNILGYV